MIGGDMTGGDGHRRGEQLTLLTPNPPPGTLPSSRGGMASALELRLVTWNVQHAAPTRARRQAAWLASQPEADVLVLTEVKDAPGGRWRASMLRSCTASSTAGRGPPPVAGC